jgi:hypothetical protein
MGVHMSAAEKISLQDLYPPWPVRNGTPVKGRWGWVDVDVGSSKKISLQDYTPLAGEERDSGERTMGVGQILST